MLCIPALAFAAADWAEKVSLNGQVRVRGYHIENMWNFNENADWDHWDMFRIKGSLKATVKASDDVTAVIQLANQTYGDGIPGGGGDNIDNKVFLDNAYINVRNMMGIMDLTLGRQNLIYGTGFVILDGNSQFASTSIYFDGLKLRFNPKGKTYLDLIHVKDNEGTRDTATDDDIFMTGAYLTTMQLPMKGELYALNRMDETLDKDIWTFGARLSDKMDSGLDYSLEAAMQTGEASAAQDQDALGYKVNAGYAFKDGAMSPRLYCGYAYMSGDDGNTAGDNEGWDVMYGGWPQFGDLLAWKYVNIGGGNSLAGVYNYNKLSSTGGEAVYSNLKILTLGASAKVTKAVSADLSHSMLKFDETLGNVDDDFGGYTQAKLKYAHSPGLSFSLYAAMINPGAAFGAAMEDEALEVYWEADLKF